MRSLHVLLFFSYTMLNLVGLSTFLCALYPQKAYASFPDSIQCTTATTRTEHALQLPDGFLSAISRVETGRPQENGRLAAWPWSVNAAGVGHQYNSLHEAVEAVKTFQSQGIQSIDVGCMQVNIMHHPNAFSSLEAAFDPQINALYAGHFLQQMHNKTGSWPRAAAAYHSQTPALGDAYLAHVLAEWAVPQDGRPVQTSGNRPHQTAPQRITNIPPTPHRPFTQANAVAPPANRATVRNFHPFQGIQHFASSQPPPRKTTNSLQGRGLASYRASPVRMMNNTPYPSAY